MKCFIILSHAFQCQWTLVEKWVVRAGRIALQLRVLTVPALRPGFWSPQSLPYFLHSCKYLILSKQKTTNVFPTKVTGSRQRVRIDLLSQRLHTEWNAKATSLTSRILYHLPIFLKIRRSFVLYVDQPKRKDLKTLPVATVYATQPSASLDFPFPFSSLFSDTSLLEVTSS